MNNTWTTETRSLSEALLERVLLGMGFSRRPEPTLEGLRLLYGAWCQKVPFDNVRNLLHVRAADPGPLPGNTAADFLEGWLRFGCGGTCWAGAGALHAVLAELGFEARRGIGTMLVAPDLPPNHATVGVNFDDQVYLVDYGILHGEPLLLRPDAETRILHPAWGLRCSRRDGRWHIQWRPLHRLDGFECRLERFGASGEEFQRFHAQTRGWSPFNYQVYARINRGQGVVGVAFGQRVCIESNGRAITRPVSAAERKQVLPEMIGISEELLRHLPEDIPTPPPPSSRTTQHQLVTA
jgi:N-hydroxyarylamine O-acetyltransferase